MTPKQEKQIQLGIDFATKSIQNIEAGSDNQFIQIAKVEFELVFLLGDVVEALPDALRVQAQACIEAHKRLRNAYVAQREAEIAQWEAKKKRGHSHTLTQSRALR